MKFICVIFAIQFLIYGYGHNHWFMLDNISPQPGETVQLTINSGHHFPEGTFALPENFLVRQMVISPSGQSDFQTQVAEKQRHASFEFKEPGIYLFQFDVKKPQMKKIKYSGRMWIATRGIVEAHSLKLGKGLEIVPQELLFSLKPGEDLAIQVLNNDQPVKAACTVFFPDGTQVLLQMNPGEATNFKLKSPGSYLLISHYNGAGSSLVFHLTEDLQ